MSVPFNPQHGLVLVRAAVDGLLGLDFFRGQSLTVDFRTGQVTLA